jgi:restriction system protein
MSIPDFQTIMLPMLLLLGNGKEHTTDDYVTSLAQHFDLDRDELRALLPSGRQPVFRNRVGWAATHMYKAGLLERTGRGRIRITERGRSVLGKSPERINLPYLNQFPEFRDFRSAKGKHNTSQLGEKETPVSTLATDSLSPDELLETSYQQLRKTLAEDLLERVKAAPPAFFEQLVVDLLVAMGYGGSRSDAGQAVGGSGDGGIDGIIKEDRLGLDFVYIQAKRWEGTVSRPTIQGFAGSLEGQRARKGVFITTSRFSKDADAYVKQIEKRIVLIDGEQLAQYMLDFGIGVTDVASYKVQRVDVDYFDEG